MNLQGSAGVLARRPHARVAQDKPHVLGRTHRNPPPTSELGRSRGTATLRSEHWGRERATNQVFLCHWSSIVERCRGPLRTHKNRGGVSGRHADRAVGHLFCESQTQPRSIEGMPEDGKDSKDARASSKRKHTLWRPPFDRGSHAAAMLEASETGAGHGQPFRSSTPALRVGRASHRQVDGLACRAWSRDTAD
jgi:hypothetical protein